MPLEDPFVINEEDVDTQIAVMNALDHAVESITESRLGTLQPLRQERIIRYALVERLARVLADMARRDGIKETLQAVSAILHIMLARFNSDGPDEDENDDES